LNEEVEEADHPKEGAEENDVIECVHVSIISERKVCVKGILGFPQVMPSV